MTKNATAELMSRVFPTYAWHGDMLSRSMTFTMGGIDCPVKPVTLWEGSRFVRDKSNVVAISNLDAQIVRFGYSRLEPYESWEEFIKEGKLLINGFVAAQKADPIVMRVGVRFINRIVPPDAPCPMSDIIYNIPPDPRGVANISANDFFYKDTSYYHEFKLHATSVRTTQRTPDGKQFIVVDNDVFRALGKEFSVVDWDGLFADARGLKNALFFGSLNEKFVKERLEHV